MTTRGVQKQDKSEASLEKMLKQSEEVLRTVDADADYGRYFDTRIKKTRAKNYTKLGRFDEAREVLVVALGLSGVSLLKIGKFKVENLYSERVAANCSVLYFITCQLIPSNSSYLLPMSIPSFSAGARPLPLCLSPFTSSTANPIFLEALVSSVDKYKHAKTPTIVFPSITADNSVTPGCSLNVLLVSPTTSAVAIAAFADKFSDKGALNGDFSRGLILYGVDAKGFDGLTEATITLIQAQLAKRHANPSKVQTAVSLRPVPDLAADTPSGTNAAVAVLVSEVAARKKTMGKGVGGMKWKYFQKQQA